MRLINEKAVTIPSWLGFLIIGLFIASLAYFGGRTQNRVLETAHRVSAMNKLGQIAKSYLAYSTSGNNSRSLSMQPGDTAHELAYILARSSYLNEASVWFVNSDEKLAGEEIPRMVVLGNAQTHPINPAFARLPLSVEILGNLPPHSSPTTTPIAWTRGLQSDGTWAPDSPWKGEGGHIAYLDGHIEWVEKFSSFKYGTTIPTTNIREALPPGAVILSAEPKGQGR